MVQEEHSNESPAAIHPFLFSRAQQPPPYCTFFQSLTLPLEGSYVCLPFVTPLLCSASFAFRSSSKLREAESSLSAFLAACLAPGRLRRAISSYFAAARMWLVSLKACRLPMNVCCQHCWKKRHRKNVKRPTPGLSSALISEQN